MKREAEEMIYRQFVKKREEARDRKLPDKPPDKVFKPKNPEIGKLQGYKGSLPEEYWKRWTKKEIMAKPESWVDPRRLREEAEAVGIDQAWVNTVCERLTNGADTGCRGPGRAPTRVGNSPTAEEEGERLADTLQSWVKSGIVAGPFKEEELPWTDFTVSPLLVRRKPDNSVRIILDMSAPHVRERRGEEGTGVPEEVARSVNDGINKAEFPTKMTSTFKVLDTIHRVGVPCEAMKVDWASAYKHQAVRLEDRKLQVIQFGGRFFVETQMTFGCSSSPGIFDSLSYLVMEIAIRRSQTDRDTIQKQLDDVVMFGQVGTGKCEKFYKEYKDVCGKVGVRLAPEDDPEKAFGPSRQGVILGVDYDLRKWTWRLPRDKMVRLVWQLEEVIKNKEVKNELAMSVVGKLTHYRDLVRNGYWERGFLLKLPRGTEKNRRRTVTENMRIQARWWQVSLLAAESGEKIPDRRGTETLDRAVLSTDAAGGSGALGVGMGGVVVDEPNKTKWFFCPWPELIRYNRRDEDGNNFGQKLTMLEGTALLTGLTAAAGRLAGRAVTAYTDNIGFVYAWANRNSRDPLTYTVAKALHDVAEGLGISLAVRKVPRCSDKESEAADALSKCDFDRAFENIKNREEEPMRIPREILRWLKAPRETASLGREILTGISERDPSIRVRDWNEGRL